MPLRRRRILLVAAWVLSLVAAFAWGRSWPRPRPAVLKLPPAPHVALIIDDCGYHQDTVPMFRRIDRPLTLSVLPHLAHSRAMAELGAAQPFEVMLHLPLEPTAGRIPSKGLEQQTLTTRMSREDIRRRLSAALESVPHARGVNNHMGSKATADAPTMRVILAELKARRLYFVDSLVTADSVCAVVAREVGIRFGQRAVFLDNDNRPEYIRKQLRQLAAYAKRRGSAIGIGHDRPTTLTVIRQMIPELEAQGVRFVRVSDIVRN